MYTKAQLHFKKVDPRLYEASLGLQIDDLKASSDLFRDIVWTIIGQQLSGKVADAIFERFEKLFANKKISPEKILKMSEEKIRTAGLSGSKARALKDLSSKIVSKELNLEHLPNLSDRDVSIELTKVKGIGPWTAEMLLMFSLGRTDIFSMGDLVLKKEIMNLHGWKKLPSEKKLRSVLELWSPYRTYAAKILWKIADKRKQTPKQKAP